MKQWLWLLDLAVALAVTLLIAFVVLGWIAEYQCTSAGGVVLKGPVDQFCEVAGSTQPLSLRVTTIGWVAAGTATLATVSGLYWGLRRFIRARPDPNR
jgi:hypothetical protein